MMKTLFKRFKDKTFIGFYFKSPYYYFSIVHVTDDQQFVLADQQKQLFFPSDFLKKACIFAPIPLAETTISKQSLSQDMMQYLPKNQHAVVRTFDLGFEYHYATSLQATVPKLFFQEQSIRFGKDIFAGLHYEVDVFALWHLIYWQNMTACWHEPGLWIYETEYGLYLLLGRGENLWAYTFVSNISAINGWLNQQDWPKPGFYSVLNPSHSYPLQSIIQKDFNDHREWTLSTALALRGAYAAI